MYQQAPIQNLMYCTVEDNTILQCNYGQPFKKIGVTMEKYNDALKLINEYRNKLIELGVIEKEKSPEELQKETNALLIKLNDRINNMEEQLNEYKKSSTAREQFSSASKESSVADSTFQSRAGIRKSPGELSGGREKDFK